MWNQPWGKRGGFVDLVYRLVLFHQSLIGVKDFPPKVELTAWEQFLYFDPKMYDLMLVLMMADAGSYFFMHNKPGMQKNNQEFMASNFMQKKTWYLIYESDWIKKYPQQLGFT